MATPMTGQPIEHTCDGTDKRRCPCAKERLAELRRIARRGNYEIARRDNLRRAYGISMEQYDAMREEQGYCCAICLRHEDELPRHAGGRPRKDGSPPADAVKLVVDHCHLGGGNRALLCQGCNAGLGQFNDDPERLERAAVYLRSSAVNVSYVKLRRADADDAARSDGSPPRPVVAGPAPLGRRDGRVDRLDVRGRGHGASEGDPSL